MQSLLATSTTIDMFSELIFVEVLQHVNIAGVQLPAVVMDQSGQNGTGSIGGTKFMNCTGLGIHNNFLQWLACHPSDIPCLLLSDSV